MAIKRTLHLPRGAAGLGPAMIGQDPAAPSQRGGDDSKWPIAAYDVRLNPTPEQADRLRRHTEMVSNLGGDWTLLVLMSLADRVKAGSGRQNGLRPAQEILRKRLVFLSWFVPIIPVPGKPQGQPLERGEVWAKVAFHLAKDGIASRDIADWKQAVEPVIHAPLRDGAGWQDLRTAAKSIEEGQKVFGLPSLGAAPGAVFGTLIDNLFGADLEKRFLLDDEEPSEPNTTQNARSFLSQMLGSGEKGDFAGAGGFADLVERSLRAGQDVQDLLKALGVASREEAAKKADVGRGNKNSLVRRLAALPETGSMSKETVERLRDAAQEIVAKAQARMNASGYLAPIARTALMSVFESRTGYGYRVPVEKKKGQTGEIDAVNDHCSILALALSQVMRHHSWTLRAERSRLEAENRAADLRAKIAALEPGALTDWRAFLETRRQDPSHALDLFSGRATQMLPRILAEWADLRDPTPKARMERFRRLGRGRTRADLRLVEALANGSLPWALTPGGASLLRQVLDEADAQAEAERLKPPAFRVPHWPGSPLYPMFGKSRPAISADGQTLSLTCLIPGEGLKRLDIPWSSKRLAQEIGTDLGRGTRLSRRATGNVQVAPRPIFENGRLALRRSLLEKEGAVLHWHLHTTVHIPPEGPWVQWCRRNGWPHADRLPKSTLPPVGPALRGEFGGLSDLRVLGVDLGQRAAAGAAVWHVLPNGETPPGGRRTVRPTGRPESPVAVLERMFLIELPGERNSDLRPIYQIERDFLTDCARVLQEEVPRGIRKAAEGHEAALRMLRARLRALGEVGRAIRHLRDRRVSYKPGQAEQVLDPQRLRERRANALERLQKQAALDVAAVHDIRVGLDSASPEGILQQAHERLSAIWTRAFRQAEEQARKIERWVLFGRLSGQGHKRLWLGTGGLSMARIQRIEALRGLRMALRDIDRPEDWNTIRPHAERGPDFAPGLTRRANALREERARVLASRLVEAALGLGAHPKGIQGKDKARPRESDVPVCHAIAIERLTNYRPDDARPEHENRRLRDWMVGRVRTHLVQACALHGLALLEVDPDMTSQTDHRTGRIGLRGVEMPVDRLVDAPEDELERPARAARGKHWDPIDQIWRDQRGRTWRRAGGGHWQDEQGKPGLPPPLFVWRAGGPLFVSEDHPIPIHADLNAAANVAWRAISNPLQIARHAILPVDGSGTVVLGGTQADSAPYKGAPFLGHPAAIPSSGGASGKKGKGFRFAAASDPDWTTPSPFVADSKRKAREKRQEALWLARLGVASLEDDQIPWI